MRIVAWYFKITAVESALGKHVSLDPNIMGDTDLGDPGLGEPDLGEPDIGEPDLGEPDTGDLEPEEPRVAPRDPRDTPEGDGAARDPD